MNVVCLPVLTLQLSDNRIIEMKRFASTVKQFIFVCKKFLGYSQERNYCKELLSRIEHPALGYMQSMFSRKHMATKSNAKVYCHKKGL